MGIMQCIAKGFSESSKLIKIVLIFLAFNFVMGLIALPFSGPENAAKPGATTMAILISFISMIVFIFLQGGALGLIRDLLKNNSFSLSDFVNNGKKYYLRILGLFLVIIGVVLVLVVLIALLASLLLSIANNPFTTSLVGAIAVVLSLIAVVLLLYPIYIVVLEEKGPIEALKKGIDIGRKNFWRILGLFLVLLFITIAVAFVVLGLVSLLTRALPANAGQVILLLINSLLQSYLAIIMMVAFMSFYLSLSSGAASKEGPSAV